MEDSCVIWTMMRRKVSPRPSSCCTSMLWNTGIFQCIPVHMDTYQYILILCNNDWIRTQAPNALLARNSHSRSRMLYTGAGSVSRSAHRLPKSEEAVEGRRSLPSLLLRSGDT